MAPLEPYPAYPEDPTEPRNLVLPYTGDIGATFKADVSTIRDFFAADARIDIEDLPSHAADADGDGIPESR